MTVSTDIDYAESGMTLQQAMVALAKRYPDKKNRPNTVLWGSRRVQTSDAIRVPNMGIVRIEFLTSPQAFRQGVDLKVDGWIELAGGEHVPLLRTWQDERFEDVVEYSFFAKDGILWTWNIYEMMYPGGKKVVEKWTENAGFCVDVIGENERVYHCSHGSTSPPDFDSFVYKLTIRPK